MSCNDYIPEPQSDLSVPFSWWPPEFPGVHLHGDESEQEPVTDPESEEALGARLAQSYETIDQQRRDIGRLVDRVAELEDAVDAANARTRRTRRRWSLLVQAMILLPCLAVGVVFHREVAQVGWNFFCGACDVFATAPAHAVGLLTAAAVAALFWAVGKATAHAALEDLFGQDMEDAE